MFSSVRNARQHAFTLIELLVVICIIGVLLAIAIPTFLGASGRAYNTTTTQQLASVRTQLRTIWNTNGQSYCTASLSGNNFVSFDACTGSSSTGVIGALTAALPGNTAATGVSGKGFN